jgi:hypothetical protein
MIFVLILIAAWLTVIAIVVNACRAAARGDEALARTTAEAPIRAGRITARKQTAGPPLFETIRPNPLT